MTTRVNGAVWGGGYSGAGSPRFEGILALIYPSATWHAGERIGSGRVGTGGGLEPGRYRYAGEGVDLDLETIAILRHRFLKVVPYVRRCQVERRADPFLNATGLRYDGVSQRDGAAMARPRTRIGAQPRGALRMNGLMQHWLLTIDKILEHAQRLYPTKRVTTLQPDGSLHCYTYGDSDSPRPSRAVARP